MVITLGGILTLIFLILSILHFYWAVGGKWGFRKALPTNAKGVTVLNPKVIDSVIVGLGLLFFACFYASKTAIIQNYFWNWLLIYGGWVIPSIFLLRSVGDFKYVGLFKKVKSTGFAKLDTQYFIPLCLIIAFLGFMIQILLLN